MARDRPPFRDEPMILYTGLSMFAEIAQAASRTRRSSVVVARVTLREGYKLHVAKTLTDPGHYTVWGGVEDLLSCSELVDLD
jgi:hypothetical protein